MNSKRTKKIETYTRTLPAVRCTESEYANIQAKARKAGMTLSSYVRKSTRVQKIVVKKSSADSLLLFQLKKIGTNLNQQTRKFNQTGVPPGQLNEIWTKLNHILERMMKEM